MASVIELGDFRRQFPEFGEEEYTDERVLYWLGLFQDLYQNRKQFAQFYNRACYLWTAHNLVIAERLKEDNAETSFELANGQATVVHKEVGPLYKTMSYSGKLTAIPGQGQYGLTIYGQQFFDIIYNIVGFAIAYGH